VSDDRWQDIQADTEASRRHFSHAVRIYREPGLHEDSDRGYMQRMAFMHAMLTGHTSLERALLRILEVIGEDAPSGQQWHADLIRRAGRAGTKRSAILPADIAAAADRTRRFRHVAAHAYDTFDPDDADPAVRSAERIAAGLMAAIDAFRLALDP
jgi:hypothetical protein